MSRSAGDIESTERRDDVYLAHQNMMSLALSDAGRWCYGIKAIEVWLYNEKGRLQLAESGSWIDPLYFENDEPVIGSALRALYDPSNPEYEQNETVSYAPGEGLPGVLWAETSKKPMNIVKPLDSSSFSKTNRFTQIDWRDVKALSEDPDQPYNPRLMTIAKAGFRLASGVLFKNRGVKGIVIYMARESVNMQRIKSNLNEEYLLASTEHIGSVQALRRPRKFATAQRAKDVKAVFQKARRILKLSGPAVLDRRHSTIKKTGAKDEENEEKIGRMKSIKISVLDRIKYSCEKPMNDIKTFTKMWLEKMQGGSVQPPPSMPLDVSIFVVTAAFFTCIIMACVDTYLRMTLGEDLGFEYGQVASLTTMAFTLTASPAAQPRSIIGGRFISMLVGMTMGLLPDTSIISMNWVRYAGAVSISSAVMAKLGVAHPPGGSLANTFLVYRWGSVHSYQKIGIMVLQDLIFVFLAAAFNNINSSKNYPTYWGHLPNMIGRFISNKLCVKRARDKKV